MALPINQPRTSGHSARCPLEVLLPLSESAHLIWVLHCERVIQEKEQKSAPHEINTKLTDNEKTNCIKLNEKKGFTNLVVNTWEHV